MTPAELVQAAMEKTATPSIRQLADQLGVDHSMITRWTKGERPIQFEDAAVLAEMAGLPPIQTAAELRLPHAKGRKLSALLRRLSKVAAISIAMAALPHFANAKSVLNHNVDNYNFTYSAHTIHSRQNTTPAGTGCADSCLGSSTPFGAS